MIVASIVMIAVGINMIITMLINLYLIDLILDRFRTEDKFDDTITEHIYSIYDIIAYNGLVKPTTAKKKVSDTNDNKSRI